MGSHPAVGSHPTWWAESPCGGQSPRIVGGVTLRWAVTLQWAVTPHSGRSHPAVGSHPAMGNHPVRWVESPCGGQSEPALGGVTPRQPTVPVNHAAVIFASGSNPCTLHLYIYMVSTMSTYYTKLLQNIYENLMCFFGFIQCITSITRI